MKPRAKHDCAGCADLRGRLGDLEQRVVALEQVRPRLRLVDGETPPGPEVAPVWQPLPRGRRVRVDAAHAPRAPHPLLVKVFVSARDGAAYRGLLDDGMTTRPRVLDRVA